MMEIHVIFHWISTEVYGRMFFKQNNRDVFLIHFLILLSQVFNKSLWNTETPDFCERTLFIPSFL